MKRKRHTEDQIIAILKEHEAGVKTADLCRKHGISDATFYNWKAKYGGLEVSEAKRLRGLESENGKLKRIVVAKTGASPRIVKAKLIGSGGVTTATGPTLQANLALPDTWATFKKK